MMKIPLQMMLVALAGWVNEQQLAVIEYLSLPKTPSVRPTLGSNSTFILLVGIN